MQPAAMHEHGCENRDRVCLRIARKSRGNERPFLDELVPAGKLDEEDQDIEADESIGDVWGSPPLRVVVADREHAGVLPRFGSGSAAIIAEVGGKSIGLEKPGANGGADWQRFCHKRQIPK